MKGPSRMHKRKRLTNRDRTYDAALLTVGFLLQSSHPALAFISRQPTIFEHEPYPGLSRSRKGSNKAVPATLDRNKTDNPKHTTSPSSPLFATSSRELKKKEEENLKSRKLQKTANKEKRPKSKNSQEVRDENDTEDSTTKQISLTERLQRATAKAKAAAIQAQYAAKKQQLEENGKEEQQPKLSYYNTRQTDPALNEEKDHNNSPLGTLSQLTKIIDRELLSARDGTKTFNVHGTTNPPPGITRDSMRSLLEENDVQIRQQQSRKNCDPEQVRHVAVIFSKPLMMQDQVTLEYACRLRTLAKAIQETDDDTGDPYNRPCVIYFVGQRSAGNVITDADAGYLFFRHLCAANHISLDGIDIVLENTALGQGALQYIMQHLRQEYMPEWLNESPDKESFTDEYGERRQQLRKKIQVHFTLISSDYDLCRLNDIHHRSPRQSLLRYLQEQPEIDYSYQSPYASPAASPISVKSIPPSSNGIVEVSWSYRYATYPYVHFKDKATAFLGKCYLLAEELTPVLVNIRGVVDGTEFFQRDNYRVLVSIRRSFVTDMEHFYVSQPSLKATLREYVINSDYPLDVVLEGVLLSLGRCLDLVRPAGLLIGYVPNTDWKNAEMLLENVVRQLRDACDPDQPLDPSEWGNLECHFDHPLNKDTIGGLTGEDLMSLSNWRLQEEDDE